MAEGTTQRPGGAQVSPGRSAFCKRSAPSTLHSSSSEAASLPHWSLTHSLLEPLFGRNMAIEIRLPKLDESTTEADLLSWLVKSGDTVERGDVIAELETDKATVELEAPASGVMAEILVPAL